MAKRRAQFVHIFIKNVAKSYEDGNTVNYGNILYTKYACNTMDSVQHTIWLVDLGRGHKVTIFTEIWRIFHYHLKKRLRRGSVNPEFFILYVLKTSFYIFSIYIYFYQVDNFFRVFPTKILHTDPFLISSWVSHVPLLSSGLIWSQ
jgi:hypothetical protein